MQQPVFAGFHQKNRLKYRRYLISPRILCIHPVLQMFPLRSSDNTFFLFAVYIHNSYKHPHCHSTDGHKFYNTLFYPLSLYILPCQNTSNMKKSRLNIIYPKYRVQSRTFFSYNKNIRKKAESKVISNEPLWETMKRKNISTYRLIKEYGFSKGTLNSLKQNRNISTATLNDICNILSCRVEDVIKHIPD